MDGVLRSSLGGWYEGQMEGVKGDLSGWVIQFSL
jgi:hypothetical protein